LRLPKYADGITVLKGRNMAHEHTFIMVKPDGVRRGLVGEVIRRLETKGLSLQRMQMLTPSEETAGKHYGEHEGKPFYPSLIEFITSGPVVAMEWSGEDAVPVARLMIGTTNGSESAPGTIRGDYGLGVQENIVHGSDSPESAERELTIWF
jgi:nucleoside-diphosphate kinase